MMTKSGCGFTGKSLRVYVAPQETLLMALVALSLTGASVNPLSTSGARQKGMETVKYLLTSNAGNTFSSYVMINAEKRSLEFVRLKPNVVENINDLKELNGVRITEENRNILSEGGSVPLDGMTSKDGREYSANVRYDPEAKRIRYDFPARDSEGVRVPNTIKGVTLTEDQKTKLSAGEEVFLEGMTSSGGRKFSNSVYLDKEEKKIKFKPFEEKAQKKTENKEITPPTEQKQTNKKGKSLKQ